MSNRVALITGGARGIGRTIALAMAEDGWSVAICYRTSADEGQAIQEEIQKQGGDALAVRCDVSDTEAAEKFAGQVEQKWGQIDALINCAGPYHRINLLNESVEVKWTP